MLIFLCICPPHLFYTTHCTLTHSLTHTLIYSSAKESEITSDEDISQWRLLPSRWNGKHQLEEMKSKLSSLDASIADEFGARYMQNNTSLYQQAKDDLDTALATLMKAKKSYKLASCLLTTHTKQPSIWEESLMVIQEHMNLLSETLTNLMKLPDVHGLADSDKFTKFVWGVIEMIKISSQIRMSADSALYEIKLKSPSSSSSLDVVVANYEGVKAYITRVSNELYQLGCDKVGAAINESCSEEDHMMMSNSSGGAYGAADNVSNSDTTTSSSSSSSSNQQQNKKEACALSWHMIEQDDACVVYANKKCLAPCGNFFVNCVVGRSGISALLAQPSLA
jgi:hypothetical protein